MATVTPAVAFDYSSLQPGVRASEMPMPAGRNVSPSTVRVAWFMAGKGCNHPTCPQARPWVNTPHLYPRDSVTVPYRPAAATEMR